jgi:hypothetical protein
MEVTLPRSMTFCGILMMNGLLPACRKTM